MSYILDAIKRSERERLNAGASRLPVLPGFGEAAKRPPVLLYGAASAALITAGIAIGWLRPWQPGHTAAAPMIAKVAPAPTPPVTVAGADEAPAQPALLPSPAIAENREVLHVMKVRPYRSATHVPVVAHTRAAHKAPAAVPAAAERASSVATAAMAPVTAPRASAASPMAANRASSVGTAVVVPVTPPRAPAAAPVAAATAASQPEAAAPGREQIAQASAPPPATTDVAINNAAKTQAAAERKVITLYELPPAILRDIPPMSISGFTYSELPQGRMVDINDRLLQEGQYVADGLKLEQITPDSLIFTYRHYRFRKTLQ